jgi:fatty-acyl-CoA synthase
LPLYHDMGLIGCLLSAVTFPGSMVLLAPEAFLARPALWFRALSRHGATVSPAPNFAYGLCLKRVRDEDLAGVDLSRWTYALNGAEPVSAGVMARFAERFGRFGFRREALMPVYGLAEASLALTFSAPGGEKRVLGVDAAELAATGRVVEGARAVVSVGRPVPGAEVEVRADDGAVLPERTAGRVWGRAPFVMEGYFGRPEATAAAVREGWLDTGDVGFVSEAELFVCGRAKDVVIIRGANHAPQEFEECLESVAGLRAGCAVAVGFAPPGVEGEQLLVLAEASDGVTPELAQRASAAIVDGTGIKPHTVTLLASGTLPRTSSGKLRRGEALRRYLAGELSAPAPVDALTMTREVAKSAVAFVRTRLG